MEIEDRREDVTGAKELYQELARVIAASGDELTATAVHTALILLVDTFCWATETPHGRFIENLITESRNRANAREEKAKLNYIPEVEVKNA
jgi:hypothetical protein